ncbi:hypothetical protein JKS50_12490 [Listeria monocytogenes]|nr:hypothetical protein [Listeria monocytogenes]MCP7732605.1 hypothetical protein [Listeria monocytogenes]
MIAATLILTGCGNGDAEKTDTKEQTKSVEEEGKEVKIESNERKPQHEQLITVKLPPEAEFIKDKKKYDQTNQLITNDSITVLVGDYGYYDSVWGSLDCSAVIINGTKSSIKDLSFEVSVEDNVLPGKVFLNSEALSLTKTQIGDFEPNTGVPIVITFPEKNATGEDEDKKIDTKNVKIQIKNIQFTAID